MLREFCQLREVTICDDERKNAHEYHQFVQSTYTVSDEQAFKILKLEKNRCYTLQGRIEMTISTSSTV